MTIQTLKLIHSLLQLEEENTRASLNKARTYLYALEEKNENIRDIENARAERDFTNRLHTKALNALNDFEEHEWR